MKHDTSDYPFRCLLNLKPLINYLKEITAESETYACHVNDLDELLKNTPELNEPIEDPGTLKRHDEALQKLMDFVFPVAFWDTEAFACMIPFSRKPILISPAFKRLFLEAV